MNKRRDISRRADWMPAAVTTARQQEADILMNQVQELKAEVARLRDEIKQAADRIAALEQRLAEQRHVPIIRRETRPDMTVDDWSGT